MFLTTGFQLPVNLVRSRGTELLIDHRYL